MFKTQRMVKVGIVCPNNLLDKVINKLYDLKVIQIEDYEKGDENGDFSLGHPLKKGEELSELLIKLRSIASQTGINLQSSDYKKEKINFNKIQTEISNIHSTLKVSIEKAEFYKKALASIKKKAYQKAAEDLKIDSFRTKDKESFLFCGLIKNDAEKEIRTASETSFVMTKDADGVRLIFILAPKSKKEELQIILNKNLFVGLDKSDVKDLFPKLSLSYASGELKADELSKLLLKEEKTLDSEIKRIKAEDASFLFSANQDIEDELEKCEAPIKFAATKNTHIINGWVPKERFEKVKATLEKETEDKIYVHLIQLRKEEIGPVLLKNPKPANSFQYLLDLFSLPTYWEIDPTMLMFITFPFFFGFMLGDIGYGIVTLILFTLMRLKFNKGALRPLLNILIMSSVGTIIFGFLFGEIFGEEVVPFLHIELPHILSRGAQINDLLSITLIIGVIHLLLGLILGFINITKHHGLKHAVYEKLGWILLLPLILWIVTYLKIVSGFTAVIVNNILPPFLVIIGIAIIAVIIIIMGEGFKGAIELPGILSNVLSYARLMAVGLASVELAIIINEMSKEMFHKGGIMIIFAVITLLIGHIINLMLGLLGPALHSLRLHYVEFFGKFYVGGGKRFIPFGEKD